MNLDDIIHIIVYSLIILSGGLFGAGIVYAVCWLCVWALS